MKVLLINPIIRDWSNPNIPPLGLLYMSAVLKEHDVQCDIYDINGKRHSKDEVEKFIAESDYDIYGMGGIVTVYGYCSWLAGIVKQYHPQSCVVWGGPVTTSAWEIIQDHDRELHPFFRPIQKNC